MIRKIKLMVATASILALAASGIAPAYAQTAPTDNSGANSPVAVNDNSNTPMMGPRQTDGAGNMPMGNMPTMGNPDNTGNYNTDHTGNWDRNGDHNGDNNNDHNGDHGGNRDRDWDRGGWNGGGWNRPGWNNWGWGGYNGGYYYNQTRYVNISNYSFTPYALYVNPGTTVVWTNYDYNPHTITSSNGGFNSGMLYRGQSYSVRFVTPGTYWYYCSIHPNMRGMIVVR